MKVLSCRSANSQRGALLLATLIALAARQRVLSAADQVLAELELELQIAVLAADQGWIDAALAGQALPPQEGGVELRYKIAFCCDTIWDFSQPLSADNQAQLYHLEVQATAGEKHASTALQSTYLIAPATSLLPLRARRVAWRRLDPTL
jgi:hypothetical protein